MTTETSAPALVLVEISCEVCGLKTKAGANKTGIVVIDSAWLGTEQPIQCPTCGPQRGETNE